MNFHQQVLIEIHDVTGARIRALDIGYKPVGYYTTREGAAYWDGTNTLGEQAPSGIYFYTLVTASYTETRKMLVVK